MQAGELIQNYSYVGDIISFIIGMIIFILIQQSLFFSKSATFTTFKRALLFVMIAATANLLFYLTVTNQPDQVWKIFLTRDLYHFFLMASLYAFIVYLRDMLELDGKSRSFVNMTIKVVFSIFLLLDLLSPVTKFGFYYENGLWYDSTYMKPFTWNYIFAMLLLAWILFFYSKRMIKQIRYTLIFTEAIVAVMLFVQNLYDSNSYTTFTYIMPMMVVFTTIHSKPYDLLTGAMEASAFSSYINHARKKGHNVDYVILRLELDTMQNLPRDIGHAIHSVWYRYFRRTYLFRLQKGIFVLAIEHGLNEDTSGKINSLIQTEFKAFYEAYQIPYRIILIPDASFVRGLDDINRTIKFYEQTTEVNSVHFLNKEESQEIVKIRKIVAELADISEKFDLEDPRVLAYCQPIMNAKTGVYETGEVLVRLQLPEMGIVFPNQFIDLAEENGYIHALSCIVLNKACKAIRSFLEEDYHLKCFSVNFSISEVKQKEFGAEIMEIIHKNQVPADAIAIELTEGQNDRDYKSLSQQIQNLQKEGIRFYLDDFGSGYSNFDRVLSLDMDVVKFDRSLLLYSDRKTGNFTLTYFAKAFKHLGYKILFEGVETKEQEQLCVECGADYLQGYKYAKPVPVMEMKKFLSKENVD